MTPRRPEILQPNFRAIFAPDHHYHHCRHLQRYLLIDIVVMQPSVVHNRLVIAENVETEASGGLVHVWQHARE